MQRKRPTIFDVAAHAGVSTSTVSRALNAHPAVDPATRARVLASVDALGFIPRSEAVSRARRSARRVGVTAPFSAHPSYWRVMNGIMRAVQGAGIELAIFDHPSTMVSPALAALPLTDRVDGLLVMGTPLDDAVANRLVEGGLPTVLVDSEYSGFATVAIDSEHDGLIAGRVLLERGIRRFLFLGHRPIVPDPRLGSMRRAAGLHAAVAAAGLPPESVATALVADDFDEALEAARAALARDGEGPLGVVAHHDGLAAAVVRAAAALGRSVPDEVAIVAFDDTEVARALDLTSVHVPFEEAGEAAAGLLLGRIAGTAATAQRLVLESHLARRSSA